MATETFTLTLDNTPTESVSVTINDTSQPFAVALGHTLNNPNAYDTATGDQIGYRVQISNNYAVVSSVKEDDANGLNSGKVYIFNAATGVLVHTLDNPGLGVTEDDQFGHSVDVSDTHVIVGAPGEDVDGDNQGKAYIYNVTTGALVHTLDNPNPNAAGPADAVGDQFGHKVAISNTHAIVCAVYEDDPVPGGDAADGYQSGKAYIYNVTTGDLVHTLDNPNPVGTTKNDIFGFRVAMSDDHAIVGAPNEDDTNTESGKAYIFSVATGELLHTLDNPNAYGTSADDLFGTPGISGNYAVVGAWREDDAIGVDRSGKAYVFNVTTGELLHTLDNPNAYGTTDMDFFGFSVAVEGNYAIIGAPFEDDASGLNSGKAYIFDITDGSLVETLDNPNPQGTGANDWFGYAVGISGNYAIVSAYQEDEASSSNTGKAYIYDLSGTGA